MGFSSGVSGKESAYNAGAVGGDAVQSWVGKIPGGGHGNPLQCACLENPMDRGAWRAIVHGVSKSWTQLKPLSTHMAVIKHKEIES